MWNCYKREESNLRCVELGGSCCIRELLVCLTASQPLCLLPPPTTLPPPSSQTNVQHQAHIALLLQKALIKCQGFSAALCILAYTQEAHCILAHKREGGSNTSGAISHHLWPGGNCTYSSIQVLKFSRTQVLTHSMYSRYLYPGTRGRYPSKYFSPVQCSVSDFPPPLARRKL